jgi:hypothetical protein
MIHDINAAAARCFDAMGDEATNLTDTEQEAGAVMIHTVIAALASMLKTSPDAAAAINTNFAERGVPWRLMLPS